MKYLLYSFLALGISCGIPKKSSDTNLTEPTEKEIIVEEKKLQNLLRLKTN